MSQQKYQWQYVALLDGSVYHWKRATNPSLAWCGIDVSDRRFQPVDKEATLKKCCKNCCKVGGLTNEGSLIWERELEASGAYDVDYEDYYGTAPALLSLYSL